MNGSTIMKSITAHIIDPIILLLFSAGVFLFMWGLVVFAFNADNAEKRKIGQEHMLWGIIGIFIMATVFGIITMLTSTFGLDNPMQFYQ